eukprot:1181510-Prorocentrum_minimum.AAC.5
MSSSSLAIVAANGCKTLVIVTPGRTTVASDTITSQSQTVKHLHNVVHSAVPFGSDTSSLPPPSSPILNTTVLLNQWSRYFSAWRG